jgi:hypothetical protein
VDRFAAFLRRLAISAFVLTAALAGFNALVDPYGKFPVPRIDGLNRLPLGFNHRPGLAKALAIERVRPASVILGNSRAESAYDPGHPGFSRRPAYNLAMGGAGVRDNRRYFLEAMALGNVKQVLIALDLETMEPPPLEQARIPVPVLLTDEAGRPRGRAAQWQRLAFVLLSGATSSDSWWSLRHQRDAVATYTGSGQREEPYDELQVEREGGNRSASLGVEASFLATTLRDTRSSAFRADYAVALGQLAEILDLATRRGARVDVVINPIHARHSYLYAVGGLWPLYEQWKRDLVALASRPGRAVALWDFSGVSPCTAEPMPRAGDAATRMRWYRESGHFRPRLGTIVLDRVFERANPDCADLGTRLEPANLDATLARQRGALARWISTHAEDVAEIDALARRYGRGPASAPAGTG